MADSYLTKIFSSNGNRRTMAISFWIKRSSLGAEETLFGSGQGSVNSFCRFEANSHLKIFDYNGQAGQWILETSRQFLDTTSWYHIHYILDSSQSTAADRVQLYVNGVRETAFATETYPNQDTDFNWNSAAQSWAIGAKIYGGATSSYFDGQMAHFNFVDGTASAPTVFGETDSTTGEWKPILSPSVTYGSEGFFLKFENSGALGTDSSGNSNTFTVNGNLKQSISTPSNLFATFNYLHNGVGQQNVISKAGTQIDHANDTFTGKITAATLGMNKGKWYWETKYSTTGGYLSVGFARNGSDDITQNMRGNKQLGDDADAGGNSWAFRAGNSSGQIVKKLRHNNQDAVADMGVTPAVNDIIQCWLDLDNGKAWWGINGTVMDSGSGVGVPNTGANPHFTFTVGDEFYIPAVSLYGFNGAPQCQVNFGEGRFGTTAVSSGVADNGGNGTFEYSPLAGFYSVCTKNIKDYG